jgi:tetratricopeptide (TPR) repeat protein
MKKDQQAKPKPNVSKPKPRSAEKSFLSRIPWLAALLLAVGIAYGPVLNKEFINYDDDLYIVKNPNVMNFGPGNIGHVFSSFYEEQYSPLATVATGIIYRISGEKPFLYNLVALLIHLANTLLVFWLVRLLLENFYPALLAAAIFGLHAANVEASAWAAAVFKIGLYAMFFLLSVIAYVHYVRKAEMKFLFLSLAAFLLSCFSKEQAAALPATIVLIDYFYGRKLLSGKVIAEKVPFALISLTFAFVSIASTALNRAGIEATPFSMADKITYSAQALTHYLTTMVLPVGLYLNYAILSIKDMGFVFYLNLVTFLLVAAALVYFLVKKMKVPFFALAFFMANILFALLLAVVSVRETITADRYVYISSIAYGLIMGYLAHWVYSRKMSNLPAVAGIGAAYILMLGFMANSYASTWKNSFTVMDRIVNHEPVQFALVNRGLWYKQHDEVEKAMEDFNRAIRIYPDKHMAYLNRGNIYFNKGKDSLA